MNDIAVVADGYKSEDVLSVTAENCCDEWILNWGCSFHMTPNQGWFDSYKVIDGGKVLMGNNMACKVVGIGTVKVKLADGSIKTFSNVRHVPDLKRNLISLRMLDQPGCTFRGENGVLKISKGALQIMKGTRINGLY